jgi:hypothetical protein
LKPAAPGDRVMAGNPSKRGRITRNALRDFAGTVGNIAAAGAPKMAK